MGDEFKILFEMVRCKQGDHALFSKLLESSVSTRYYKGLFSYLWPDTILSIDNLPRKALERWNDILLLTESEYREENGAHSEFYTLMMRKVTYLGIFC